MVCKRVQKFQGQLKSGDKSGDTRLSPIQKLGLQFDRVK
jgi:hypothetical protein